jgi:hypothetical protein
VFLGLPLGISVFRSTGGLWLPAIAAALVPVLVLLPIACWWLDPPAEHGLVAFLGFVARCFGHRPLPAAGVVAVYRMPTINLETASPAQLRQARAQWGAILNALAHPIKIVVLGRPLTTLPVVQALLEHPQPMAQQLGQWFEMHLATARLVDRERLLVIPAGDPVELTFLTEIIEKALRQAKLHAVRIPESELPTLRLRSLLMDPEESSIAEGATEALVDGWWTRSYAVGRLPSAIVTNWASPLLAGDEPCDIVLDVRPQDVWSTNFMLDARINQLASSSLTVARRVGLEQLQALRESFERRRVVPFEVSATVIVRGATIQAARDHGKRISERATSIGARLRLLRWEQAAGLLQADPTLARPLPRRSQLIETGTLARTYPWSDGSLQLAGGVPWGDAGSRPCLFTPYNPRARGPHMAWYGTTNAGKGMGAHLLWSRLHWAQGVRIFGIDQDEQHEHCGRFLTYLGGRKLTPRDSQDAAAIELHADDGW